MVTTVQVWAQQNEQTHLHGTGLIYAHQSTTQSEQIVPMLITVGHLLEGAKRVVVQFMRAEDGEPSLQERIRVEIPLDQFTTIGEGTTALVVAPIAPVLQRLESDGNKPYYRSVTGGACLSEDAWNNQPAVLSVVTFGFPTFPGAALTFPISRSGVTATPPWTDYDGDPCFLADVGVFPGISGSPVFALGPQLNTGPGIVYRPAFQFLGIVVGARCVGGPGFKNDPGLAIVLKAEVVRQAAMETVKRIAPELL